MREHKCARAVPDLIEALDDEVFSVRYDAMCAINALCQFQPAGGLEDWLDIRLFNGDDPREIKAKVTAWWRLNKRFIENNPYLW